MLFIHSIVFACTIPTQPQMSNYEITPEDWIKRELPIDLCNEFQKDILFMYKTMFPNRLAFNNPRVEVLKKLFLMMAHVGLQTTDEKGFTEEWKNPLATSLSHGGRIIFENIRKEEFLPKEDQRMGPLFSFIFNGVFDKIDTRRAASHSIDYDEVKQEWKEFKLGFFDTLENLGIGEKGGHLGLNIPYGGQGNFGMDNLRITEDGRRLFTGRPTRLDKRSIKKIQHGHMYIQPNLQIYHKEQKVVWEAILIGIEGTEPSFMDQYLNVHNILSAFTNQGIAITGGPKMRGLLQNQMNSIIPASNGGLRVSLKGKDLEDIRMIYEIIRQKDARTQKNIYYNILKSDSIEARKYLKTFLNSYPSQQRQFYY